MPKFGDTCFEHRSITVGPEKTLVRVPRGLLGLKMLLLGAFLMFVQNVIMYVALVVFIVPNSNLHMSLHETSLFTFFERRQRPLWA